MKPRTKKAVLLLFCIVLSILALGLFLMARDEPAPDDSDLALPTRVAIPAEENAYVALTAFWSRLPSPPSDEIQEIEIEIDAVLDDGETPSAELLERLAEELGSREWLDGLDVALARPRYQSPQVSGYTDQSYVSSPRDLARRLELQAHLDFRSGREPEALRSVERLFELGEHMAAGSETLLEFVVAGALITQAAELLQDFLGSATLTDVELATLQQRLEDLRVPTSSQVHTLKVEYGMLMRALESDLSRELDLPSHRFVYKPHRTRRQAAEVFRATIRILEADAPGQQVSLDGLMAQEQRGFWQEAARFARGNSTGEEAISLVIPALEMFSRSRLRTLACVRATRVLVALRRHQLAKGQLPKSLSALVPEYLESVPQDPFDGQPLRYSVATKVIYSVGSDGVDDGGIPERRASSDGLEPTVLIRF